MLGPYHESYRIKRLSIKPISRIYDALSFGNNYEWARNFYVLIFGQINFFAPILHSSLAARNVHGFSFAPWVLDYRRNTR